MYALCVSFTEAKEKIHISAPKVSLIWDLIFPAQLLTNS